MYKINNLIYILNKFRINLGCNHINSFSAYNSNHQDIKQFENATSENPMQIMHGSQEFMDYSHKNEKFNNNTTYVKEEVNKFRLISDSWWNTEGDFKPLHSLNKLRVGLVRDGLLQSGITDSQYKIGPHPLKGLHLLDVGCGGGILCEPLARLGATVTGLDAASENIAIAKLHAKKHIEISSNVRYVQGTIEEHVTNLDELYDCIIASEVVEHVQSVDLFLGSCIAALKPGGSLFITTINKTRRSWLAAIIMAEHVLKLVPKGIHDWNKFIGPRELRFITESAGCSTKLIHGMAYVPILNKWFWVPDSSVNYALHAIKQRLKRDT